MGCTLGRITGLESPNRIRREGDTLRVGGEFQVSDALGRVLAAQLTGYGPHNTDEPVVPFIYDATATGGSLDGFYAVLGVQVDWVKLASGLFSWDAELLAVSGWQAPLFEVLCSGKDRDSAYSTAALATSWVAGPGSLDAAAVSVAASGPFDLAGDGASVKLWSHDSNLYDAALSYQVAESGYLDGACRVEMDHAGDGVYRTVVGRQVENLVGRWRLTNDLVRVYPGGSEVGSPPQALDLPGGAGNDASAPDEASFDITGDLDLMVRVDLDDWTPADEQILIAKWDEAGDQRSYMFTLRTDGKLALYISTDGTAGANTLALLSTTAVTGTDPTWVRVTYDSSRAQASFYRSTDDTNTYSAVTWVSGEGTAPGSSWPIHAGTADLHVGGAEDVSVDATTRVPAAGTAYAAAVLSGIAGTAVATPNFTAPSQFTVGGNGTDPQGNTWTVNGAADIVETGESATLGGTVDDYAVEVYDPYADEWQTKVYNVTTGGSTPTSLGVAKALTIHDNRPEVCAVRVHTNAAGAPYVDWTIRRGSTVVEGYVANLYTAGTDRAFGIFRKITEAGTDITGGLEATSDDADGHKYRLYSPDTHTTDNTEGGIHLTTAGDRFRFGVTTDARDGDVDTDDIYWAAQVHRQQVVGR